MARPRESHTAKHLAVAKAIYQLRLATDGVPTQQEVAKQLGWNARSVRAHWPPNLRSPFVTALIDPGQVGSREDAEHSAQVLAQAGYGIRPIARVLGLDPTAVRRLLGRR
jgi:hypothetical protein